MKEKRKNRRHFWRLLTGIWGITAIRTGPAPFDAAFPVLHGKSGGAEITAAKVAAQAGTIPNEILSGLGQRLDRMIV